MSFYQTNAAFVIEAIQGILMGSNEYFWLSSDMLTETTKFIGDAALRKACEDFEAHAKELMEEENKRIGSLRQSGGLHERNLRSVLRERRRIDMKSSDLDKLSALNPCNLEVKEGVLYVEWRPEPLKWSRLGSIEPDLEDLAFYSARLLKGDISIISRLLDAAQEVESSLLGVYRGFIKDQKLSGTCDDDWGIEFNHVSSEPGTVSRYCIGIVDEADPDILPEWIVALMEKANVCLEWLQTHGKSSEESVQQAPNEIASGKIKQIPETPNGAAPEAITWNATDRDFADLITELWQMGYIKANSQMDALKTAALHFEGVNPDARILQQNLTGRKNEGKEGSRFNLPEPTKKRKSVKH